MSDTVEFDLASGTPRRIGHFTILAELGSGAMGTVYSATDETLGKQVALKIIKPDLAKDATLRERFLREARAAASLRDHDHIVGVYSVQQIELGDGRYLLYLTMPLLKGITLQEYLNRLGNRLLSLNQQLVIGRQIAEGLADAHEEGLIHRDIKPGNIWLEARKDGSTRVKILDFGLARSERDAHLTSTGAALGTPAFMAPEQGSSSNVDHRADLWSLGIILYQMATGRLPFEGTHPLELMINALTKELPSPRHWNPSLTDDHVRLIEQLLQKKAQDRPSTARDVAARLKLLRRATASMETHVPVKTTPETRPLGGVGRPPIMSGRRNAEEITLIQSAWAGFLNVPIEYAEMVEGVELKMVLIPPGTFWMGSAESEPGRHFGETQRRVTIEAPFYIAKFPITQTLYETLMGRNPSHFCARGMGRASVGKLSTRLFPVENISFRDACEFVRKLNQMKSTEGQSGYRMPSEAEWEYACRAGDYSEESTPFHFAKPQYTLGASDACFDAEMPYGLVTKGVPIQRTMKVGSFLPNRFGLFDMHGSVWEWCSDVAFHGELSGEETQYALRGGSWGSPGAFCRAASRVAEGESVRRMDFGFRIVATIG